jgi:hypothetical protein
MAGELPSLMWARVAELPEFRMGVHRVVVRLVSGAWFDDVLVFGGRVTRVLGQDGVPFDPGDVVAVEDQSERPLPRGI